MRLTLTGLDVEAVALPQVRLGDDTRPRGLRGADQRRLRRAAGDRQRPGAGAAGRRPRPDRLPRHRGPARHRRPSGGQPGGRRRRHGLRHLQRLARAAVQRVGVSHRRRRRPRRLRHRPHQRDVDGLRSAGPAARLQPLRRHRLAHRRARPGRDDRLRARRRHRPRLRSRRRALRRRSLGDDLPRVAPAATPSPSRRCRRASPPITSPGTRRTARST